MRILFVKLSPIEAITSSMYRTLAVARGFYELGYEIDFLTLPMDHCHARDDEKEFLHNFRVIYAGENAVFKKLTQGGGRTLGRKILLNVLRKVWHKVQLYDNTKAIAKKVDLSILGNDYYDYVISSSDPKSSHLAVKRLSDQGMRCGRWIQYWGDPMAGDITRRDLYPDFIVRRIEKTILGGADQIIYVSPFTLSMQKKFFPEYGDKMFFLPVPYMEEKIYPATKNDVFSIGYYGNYSSSVRDILPFYTACRELSDHVAVSIAGDGDVALEETEHIKIYPRMSISELEKKADLLVCILNKKGTQIPGKIYHSAATNKAVLVILDGEQREAVKQYLRAFQRFEMCDNRAADIRDAIARIQKLKREFRPLQCLSGKNIAGKFLNPGGCDEE